MKSIILLASLLLSTLTLAKPPKTTALRSVLTLKNNAMLPRFGTDQRGQVVLSWVEKPGDGKAQFFYALSADGGKSFGPKVQVTAAPPAISAHSEGMPKIAFKQDGTVMALFEIPKPTDEAPRASDLLFSESKDGGRTWTEARAVHRDQTPGKGHSFADMSRLPNGQVGIVWLDEKMPGYDGRAVKFTQTLPTGGFGPEVLVDSNACQCCRTSLLPSPDGRLHVAYRDLISGNKKAGEADSRDMSYVVSADGGQTFSKPVVLNPDNWRVNACPHSGIQLVASDKEIWGAWYSGTSSQAGLRLASIGDKTETTVFGTSAMKHPQVALLPDRSVLLVWDELVGEGMSAFRKIGLRQQKPDGQASVRYLTPDGQMSTGPVLMPLANRVLLAYEVEGGVQVVELPQAL